MTKRYVRTGYEIDHYPDTRGNAAGTVDYRRRRRPFDPQNRRLILGDQLSVSLSALSDIDPDNDTVLMVEAREEATHVRHHKQKIVLVISAMRHCRAWRRSSG